MSRRSLRPQLNQIRIWVHQGRTDAWIAHQLEVSASELREFRRQHDLSPENASEATSSVDLRDEIEAEIEAAAAEEEVRAKAQAEEDAAVAARSESDDAGDRDAESDGNESEGRSARPRRRRGRRGSRGRSNQIEGTFDHGEEGFGLWLDPAIQDIQDYSEHWAGERDVTITIEQDRIVIRRADSEGSDS